MTHLYYVGDFLIGSTIGFYASSTICLFANFHYDSIFKYTALTTGTFGLAAMFLEIQDYLPNKDHYNAEDALVSTNNAALETIAE